MRANRHLVSIFVNKAVLRAWLSGKPTSPQSARTPSTSDSPDESQRRTPPKDGETE
jgi:hypothetical protein